MPPSASLHARRLAVMCAATKPSDEDLRARLSPEDAERRRDARVSQAPTRASTARWGECRGRAEAEGTATFLAREARGSPGGSRGNVP